MTCIANQDLEVIYKEVEDNEEGYMEVVEVRLQQEMIDELFLEHSKKY